MTTTRRVTWTTDTSADPLAAARILGQLCADWPRFYRDPAIGGNALGVVQIGITVADLDRWAVSKRIRLVRAKLEWALGVALPAVRIEEPPVHRHPNRAARWRRPASARN